MILRPERDITDKGTMMMFGRNLRMLMKRIYLVLLSAVAYAAAVSCVEEPVLQESVLTAKTFVGHVDDNNQTRTTLNQDFSIRWSEDDHITVFAADGKGQTFSDVTVTDDGRMATFKGEIQLADAYYAIYPKQENAVYASEGGKITAVLPTQQTAVDGTFADGVNLAVAKTEGDNLYFRNVGAILAVKCPTAYASSAKLISRNPSVKMSGKAVIDYNDGNPVVTTTDEAVNYVQVNHAGDKLNQTFYFVVYPGVYSDGFDIVFTNTAGTHSCRVSSSKELNLKRNDNVLLYSPSGFAGWNAPTAPSGLTAAFDDTETLGMRLSWTSNAESSLLSGFNIYVKPAGSSGQGELKGTTAKTTFNYLVDGLTVGTYYDFGVSAKGSSGNKDSEIIWLNNILYEYPDYYPDRYPFEKRAGIPQFADMTLCYGGNPERVPYAWDKDRWRKHAVYTDKNGNDHWLFDSFLALEFSTKSDGVEYVYNLDNTETLSAGKEQWEQQLDYWFDSTNGFQALDDCIDEAIATAGPYPHKRYVVFSLPDPIYFQQFAVKEPGVTKYWGTIDGEEMDFADIEHRKRAYVWMIDQVRSRFAAKNYRHIELAGFYILQECLSESYNSQYKNFQEVISHASTYCKRCNEGMYWIPYGYSSDDEGHNNAIKNWKNYGFTSTILQPNKYWDTWREWSTICQDYIYDNNLGMEFEFEGSHGEGGWSSSETPKKSSSILETVMTNYDAEGTAKGQPNPQAARNKARFREYMQKCKDYGIYGNRMLVLYTGTNAWVELANSTAELDRKLYHETSKFFLLSPLKQSEFVDDGEDDVVVERLADPSGLYLEQTSETGVLFSWVDNAEGEAKYMIYKEEPENSILNTAEISANSTEYSSSVTAGKVYNFGIQAIGSAAEANSARVNFGEYKALSWAELQSYNADIHPVTGVNLGTATGIWRECGAPQNVTFTQTGNTTGTLTWTCWSGAETGFNIYVRNSSEGAWAKSHLKKTEAIDAKTAEITGLAAGGTYYFGVQTKGKTEARNSEIITIGTCTLEIKESAKVTVNTVTSNYAYVAVDYTITGLASGESAAERGLWISTTSDVPGSAGSDGVKLKGPNADGKTTVKQLIPASRLGLGVSYYMRAYVWDASAGKYVYSDPQTIKLSDQPESITLAWSKQTYGSLPSSVEVYKTTSTMNSRAFNAWYAIADPKEVDFKVMYPETVGSTKTVAAQAQADDDCYVLINGAIFGNYNIGAIITEGAMTQQWHGEIEGCYWGTDDQLYNITRAMIGVDSNGNPGAYWVGVPWQNKFYYYTSPMTTVVGQAKYSQASDSYPYPAVSWNPYYGISCGPMLVYNDKIMVNHEKAGNYYMTNYECWSESGVYYGNPDRTAIGITADGKIVLFVCDGRVDASEGAYLTELARIMKGLGCKYAMNLDGGGSTGMWVKGSGMINYKDGSWRAVKSTCGFFAK